MAYCLEFSERGKPLLFRGIYIYAGKGQKEHSPTIIFLRGGEVAADVVVGNRKRLHGATAASTFEMGDYCGMSATASPLWVRPQALVPHGELLDDQQRPIIQVVGHTQVREVMSIFPFYFVDCLGYQAQSLLIELTDNGQIIPAVNRV